MSNDTRTLEEAKKVASDVLVIVKQNYIESIIRNNVADRIAEIITESYKKGVEDSAKVAEKYRSPYTLKASENALSVEEVRMQEYVRKEIAKAIREMGRK